MEKDMLSLMTVNEDTKAVAMRIFRLAMVMLILSILFSILVISEWYSFISKPKLVITKTPIYWYNYLVRPVVAVIVIVISICAYIWHYKAYRSIVAAIEEQDHLLMNRGFRHTYTAYVLSIISFVVAILSASYRFLL